MLSAVILLTFIFVIAIFLIYGRIKGNGKVGEASVALRLKLLPKEYITINDVIVENNGYSSQIDHVVVSPYGIFVIETKNYNGWISGHQNAQQWTQNIYGHKHKFYNPVIQNQGHVRALQSWLKPTFGTLPFIPIIAFTGRARLMLSLIDANVVHTSELTGFIKKHNNLLLDPAKVSDIASFISSNRLSGSDAHHAHNVKARITQQHYYEAIAHGTCPQCGGRLVLRHGRYGTFWGCSNYPRCTFTQK